MRAQQEREEREAKREREEKQRKDEDRYVIFVIFNYRCTVLVSLFLFVLGNVKRKDRFAKRRNEDGSAKRNLAVHMRAEIMPHVVQISNVVKS